ncbi:transposase [Nocardiopsis akebiae]|uniref:Transposase n=1 Tax=Nocardiopsis akebiae TaxID=2831968 RepID=A0ABX8BZG3_9ACTN|nr:RNA-guided endonuclease TnpB family protein [Nocardiopsis akebiae]QUX27357.1 transposase [Nocardiopsis akebiae]
MARKSVKRAFRYRFYPSDAQAAELSRTFGCVRLVYNRALAERTAAWNAEQRWLSYTDSSAALTAWKRTQELSFLTEVSSVPLQQTLRHLHTAFRNFFDRRAKYPRFKSKKTSRASAEYTRSAFGYRDGRLTLAKMAEPLDIVWSRPLPEGARPSTVTVSRDVAWRELRSMLEYKCAWYGRDLVLVDRFCFSSKLCSTPGCGYLNASLPLRVREWTCPGCGVAHDRDVNAALNLEAAGLAVVACGAGVRPQRESSRTGRPAVKQEGHGATRDEALASNHR